MNEVNFPIRIVADDRENAGGVTAELRRLPEVEVEVRRMSPLALELRQLGPLPLTTTLVKALAALLESKAAA